MKQILIVGGGGFAKEVIQYILDIRQSGKFDAVIRGILSVDQPDPDILSIAPWIGEESTFQFQQTDQVLIAIGDGRKRLQIAKKISSQGVVFYSLVHPLAYVAPTATIGQGCVLAPFSFVGAMAKLEDHVVLNTYASVGHDSAVGHGVTLSPYSCINGNAALGDGVFLGTGAIVSPGVKVGRISKLASAAVLGSDCPEGSLLVGNPAKGRVMFREV